MAPTSTLSTLILHRLHKDLVTNYVGVVLGIILALLTGLCFLDVVSSFVMELLLQLQHLLKLGFEVKFVRSSVTRHWSGRRASLPYIRRKGELFVES